MKLFFIILILLLFYFIYFLKSFEKFQESNDSIPDKINIKNIYNEALIIGKKILNNNLILSNNNNNIIKAVMFDIDDTLINYSHEPIIDIINLLNYSKELGYLIIIITARSDKYYYETLSELSKHNIFYDKIYLKKDTENFYDFKSKIKESLFLNNIIEIILSVGDNWIDVNGDYSGDFIKLPNTTDNNLYSSVY